MTDAPLLSVIVPVYNGENYLRRCLESLLAQDVPDMEILVVDDGSHDGTWALLEAMAREDERIHPIQQKNSGVSAARNIALDRCRGRYIRFADADDIASPGSSAALIACMEENHSDLTIGSYLEITGPTRVQRSLAPRKNVLEQDEFLREFSWRSNSFYYGVLWNKLFRGDVIRDHHIRFSPEMKWGEDFYFITDYLAHVQRVAYLSQTVYEYHRRMGGAVVQHFFATLRRPLSIVKTRLHMYRNYRELYISLGQYPRFRYTLWLYLFRFTLRN